MAPVKLNPPTADSPGPTTRLQLKRKIEEDDPDLSTSASRPAKAPKPYTKHDIHWFLDGNVLLRIGDTGFKLHRSRLASESSWFQTLFDLQSGTAIDDDSEDKEEIVPVVDAVEVVDGCNLYCLDIPDATCPNAVEFGELLTAMDNAIEYALNPPAFPVLAQIIKAADFFRFTRYLTFAQESASKLFLDTPSFITDTPTPYAAQAIALGRKFLMPEILRCAFYELARTTPAAPTVSDENETPAPDLNPLESISNDDLRHLLKLQKRLSLSWHGIRTAMKYTCQSAGDPCRKCHTSYRTLLNVQQEHILDPIRGIAHLVNQNWVELGYCTQAAAHVRAQLLQERDSLWGEMAEWLDIRFSR